MTQTHSSLSAQQQAEKCADMGNIPLDTSEAKEYGQGLEPTLLNIPQNQRLLFFSHFPSLFILLELKPGIDLSAEIFQIANLKWT